MISKAKFVLSKSKMMEQYSIMKSMCDTVSYSLKTNFEVGKLLDKETDCMFSVHSVASLECLSDCKRAWFFAQGLNGSELDSVFSLKCESFVVDNRKDLQVLLNYIEKHSISINLLLRMKLKENTIHTGKHFVFGMYSDEVNKLVPKLKKNKLVNKLGIHFHRKTQNISEWSMKTELEQVITPETFEAIDILNMGGGMPMRYKNSRTDKLFVKIFNEIETLRKWLVGKEFIIEPGRFIAAPCVQLETEIVNVYKNNIIVNASVYNAAMDTFIAHVRLLVDGELENGEGFTIKGCTPDSMDIFRYRVYLKNPKVGDKLVFLNAGAYNFKTDFCLLPQLETVIVD
ncbi:MAG: decarboxylase [archaeon]